MTTDPHASAVNAVLNRRQRVADLEQQLQAARVELEDEVLAQAPYGIAPWGRRAALARALEVTPQHIDKMCRAARDRRQVKRAMADASVQTSVTAV